MRPVRLEQANAEAWFGGKAVQLGTALRAGLPVPPGFALAVDLVDAFAAGDPAVVAVLERLHQHFGRPLAVRSSAVGEDSKTASFAGQHLSLLNVGSAPALADAVRRIWESGHSEAALAYRKRMGITGEPRVAVIVQQMIYPDCAGVLFTRDPLTGSDQRIIEASWGFGEAIVAGLVTPDRYRIARDGSVLDRVAGTKDVALRAAAAGELEQAAIEPQRVHTLCLDDENLRALHELASRCEAVFGGTQDLEWAFAARTLYLLQRRAITVA
ncbi:MAG TPA: PEP/pyruvate-binding domain-containing protein [Casimicrobiaceae bacterium]